MTQQLSIFGDTIPQRFAAWKATPGGAQILRRMYEITAGYHADFKRYGTKVSQRLIWERIRHRLNLIEARLAKSGRKLEKERGFCLNDHFTAHAVRHMVENHPEWRAMFELRELGKERMKRRILVITEKETKVA